MYFVDEPRLRDTLVLNPHWVTDGVYRLLRAEDGPGSDGTLTLAEARAALPGETEDAARFLLQRSWVLGLGGCRPSSSSAALCALWYNPCESGKSPFSPGSQQVQEPLMADYDSPWKEALDLFFEAFLQLFFPQTHADIDWGRPCESLDKELQQIAPEAVIGRRYVDKLVKVWLKNGEEQWVLIHVDVQMADEADFPRRMYVYNCRIFVLYNSNTIQRGETHAFHQHV